MSDVILPLGMAVLITACASALLYFAFEFFHWRYASRKHLRAGHGQGAGASTR